MSAIRERFLSLAEVDDCLQQLEEKYGRTTLDFLRDADFHQTLPEDDLFKWEAFIAHRVELRSIENDLRRGYLETIAQESEPAPSANNNLALAA